MNNSLFKILSLSEKNEFIKKNGILLMSIHINNLTYALYSLGSLYVEVSILESLNGKNKVVKKTRILDNIKSLEPYLVYISIDTPI